MRCILALLVCSALIGCSQAYVPPGAAADFKSLGLTRDQLTDSTISDALSRMPLAHFPTGIAAVRIQSPGYTSDTAQGWGTGKYSVVTTRDIEKDEQFERLAKLPMITGIAPINRLLLPEQLNSDLELRKAAAALHADMLLIYTIDTKFHTDDVAAPLTVLTLGLSPNQVVHVISTASAVLMDTRNGFLYSFAEATEKTHQLASVWTNEPAVDSARKRAEERAFDKLTRELASGWPGVVKTFAPPQQASAMSGRP